jgi:hypothetical protein
MIDVQFKKGIYRLSTIRSMSRPLPSPNSSLTGVAGETVVVSPVFLPELKNLPDDVLGMKEAIEEVCSRPQRRPNLCVYG